MVQPDTRAGEAERIRERLAQLDTERAELERRLAELACARLPVPETARHRGQIANRSPTRDKIALFRSLFAGRKDVYPRRWENAGKGTTGYAPVCANEWQRGVCRKPRVRCGACPNQAFVPITDEALEEHLRGRHTLGVYPMLADDTCRFLAADFDKETWRRDAGAYLAACRAKGVPAALERSRNDMIFDDVLSALEAGRSPLVLTARKDHAERLVERLDRFARNVLFLRGGMGVKQRRAVMRRLEEIPDTDERVLVATGRYIGEGFDDARLDTLFLAMPVAWRGTLAQYVGRLHRLHPAKREVLVYDYTDEAVPTLRRMTQKRIRGYRNLGYSVEQPGAENAM